MPVGAGLSASFGVATETTFGTPVPVTRFFEFDSSTLKGNKNVAQGAGLRNGGTVARAARRIVTTRNAGGDVNLDVTTNGFGILLQHMLGSFNATATSLGGGLYRQVHNIGPLNGKGFTSQVLKPDTTGVLAQQAFTYPGCKITDWEISAQIDGEAKLKVTIDSLDEATPSNAFATTTLTASVAAGATSISTVASIPVGSYVTLDTGVLSETVQTTAVTGSGPYVSTLSPLTVTDFAHAIGVPAGSATGVNYGAATALQTASYNAGTNLFSYASGGMFIGGTTATTGGIYTNTGGTFVANVRSVSISGKNALKTDRQQFGSFLKGEQIENGWRAYTADVEVEYNSRVLYDAYIADQQTALQFLFTTPSGALLSFYAPAAFQEDGGQPEVSGPDVITQKLKFTFLDDGTNGALQAIYTSTDSTV